ncbi:MAG: ATP-dependent Clp protease ATP-binding subunit [Actinomycetota bacterium]|nr:ATP-dependent Clp protease ATP-binding subunit [Actinomycetota bacterium]
MAVRAIPDLRALVAEVERSQVGIGRLRSAVERAEELAWLADALVDHFIAVARREGRSWSEIGEALGVSKQAAQQRLTVPDLSSFDCDEIERPMTPRARRAVKIAHKEARRLGIDYVDTEHILLGLLHEKKGLAGLALEEAGMSTDEVRHQINRRFVPATGRRSNGTLTARAAEGLQRSLEESRRLGHNYLGTEHLLLGLLKLDQGLAYEVLTEGGATYEAVERILLRKLKAPALSRSRRGRRMKATP